MHFLPESDWNEERRCCQAPGRLAVDAMLAIDRRPRAPGALGLREQLHLVERAIHEPAEASDRRCRRAKGICPGSPGREESFSEWMRHERS